MLESYIFMQKSAKLLPKAKAALFWRLRFRMGSFAKAYLEPFSKWDFNQSVGELYI